MPINRITNPLEEHSIFLRLSISRRRCVHALAPMSPFSHIRAPVTLPSPLPSWQRLRRSCTRRGTRKVPMFRAMEHRFINPTLGNYSIGMNISASHNHQERRQIVTISEISFSGYLLFCVIMLLACSNHLDEHLAVAAPQTYKTFLPMFTFLPLSLFLFTSGPF